MRIRGERWRVAHCTAHGDAVLVEVAGCDAGNRGTRAGFLLPFEAVAPIPVSAAPRVVRPPRWRRTARAVLADARPVWWSLRAATHASLNLFAYQLEPALAMTRGDGCRFLIADAVGLGKTVQAALMVAELLHRRPDARVLVVSPASLRRQWQHELHHRFGLAAEILDAAGVARIAARLPSDVNPWGLQTVAISSIDYVKRPEVLRSLETLTWDVVVLDEAHNLSGRSDRHETAAMLGARARVVVLLTATPHSGDEQAFSRLCSLGGRQDADRLVMFRRTSLDTRHAASRRTLFLRVRLTPDETAMHDALFSYGRLVWSAAPEKVGRGAKLAMTVLARRACSSAATPGPVTSAS